MANQQHNTLGNSALESHGVLWQTVANAAALAALAIAAGDISQAKIVKQTDTGELWIPLTVAPTYQKIAIAGRAGDFDSSAITNASAVAGVSVTAALNTLNTAVSGAVPTTRTITATSPVRIDGGNSADLSANRTLSVTAVSNTAAGVVPLVPGTVGLALISTATASGWGVDFGANNPTTTGGWLANSSTGFFRAGLVAGSGAGSAANTGALRLQTQGALWVRNSGDTLDFFMLGCSANLATVQLGNNSSSGIGIVDLCALTTLRLKLTTGATITMSVTTTAVNYVGITTFRFDGPPTVTIDQTSVAGAGKAFSIISQGGSTGGDLVLGTGVGTAGNPAGSILLVPGKGAGLSGNINLGKASTPNWNSMQRGMFITDAELAPTSAPAGGSFAFGFSGGGTARSPSNTFSPLWANSATAATNGVVASYPKYDSKAFAAGATGTVTSWDMSAPGFGLPAINNAAISVRASIVGYSSANEYGRFDYVADFKIVAGVLTQIGTSTLVYSAADANMATIVANLVVSGTSIVLQTTTGAVTCNLTGTIWISTSSF
jgi:hypothetical protein